MAAFALGPIQCAGTGSLLDKVRVVQADTVSLIQGGFTAGSTTSEASCKAVRLSCNILVERLKPLKEKLQEEMGSIKWETLILQAYMQSVNLSASSFYVPGNNSMMCVNYGAAISEEKKVKKLYLALAASPLPAGIIDHYMRLINMAPRLISEEA